MPAKAAFDEVGDHRRRTARAVAGKSRFMFLLVDRRDPAPRAHGRPVDARHDDDAPGYRLRRELGDELSRDDEPFVLVAVNAGGDERRWTVPLAITAIGTGMMP
jgi:hypothetical protein